jgi:hypothetical protein
MRLMTFREAFTMHLRLRLIGPLLDVLGRRLLPEPEPVG